MKKTAPAYFSTGGWGRGRARKTKANPHHRGPTGNHRGAGGMLSMGGGVPAKPLPGGGEGCVPGPNEIIMNKFKQKIKEHVSQPSEAELYRRRRP